MYWYVDLPQMAWLVGCAFCVGVSVGGIVATLLLAPEGPVLIAKREPEWAEW